MAQNIQSFYQTAQDRDFARQFQFRVTQIADIFIAESDLVYIEAATLPGRAINNVTVPYHGLSFNIPGTASYPGSAGYPVTFRCDQNYDLRSVLEQVSFNTFNDNTSTGDYNTPLGSRRLIMELFNKNLETVARYALYGIYVQNIADTVYNITDTGTVATIEATIAYQFWRKQNVTLSTDTVNLASRPAADPVTPAAGLGANTI